MSKIQEWGREESLFWPPRGFHYTQGAIFIALLAAGFLMYLRFHFGLSPLEQYTCPTICERKRLASFTPPPPTS